MLFVPCAPRRATCSASRSPLALPRKGVTALNQHEWATLAPFLVTLATVFYLTTFLLAPPPRPKKAR